MIKNYLKFFYAGLLIFTSSALNSAGAGTADAPQAPVGFAGFTPPEKSFLHAMITGQKCAHHQIYKDCRECCENLGVDDDNMGTCVGICEDIKLKNLRGY